MPFDPALTWTQWTSYVDITLVRALALKTLVSHRIAARMMGDISAIFIQFAERVPHASSQWISNTLGPLERWSKNGFHAVDGAIKIKRTTLWTRMKRAISTMLASTSSTTIWTVSTVLSSRIMKDMSVSKELRLFIHANCVFLSDQTTFHRFAPPVLSLNVLHSQSR